MTYLSDLANVFVGLHNPFDPRDRKFCLYFDNPSIRDDSGPASSTSRARFGWWAIIDIIDVDIVCAAPARTARLRLVWLYRRGREVHVFWWLLWGRRRRRWW